MTLTKHVRVISYLVRGTRYVLHLAQAPGTTAAAVLAVVDVALQIFKQQIPNTHGIDSTLICGSYFLGNPVAFTTLHK